MNNKKELKRHAREAQERKQANKVVNGIFIALIALVVIAMFSYYALTH